MRRPDQSGGVRAPLRSGVLRHCLVLVLLGSTGALALSGCGYSNGFRMPPGVNTLAVPMFRNETFPLRRDVEVDVTRALKEELTLRSDLRVVSSSSQADAILEGVVLEFRQGVLTEGAADSVQESGIAVRLRIRLVSTRDGSVLVDRMVQDYAAFSNIAGEGIEVARTEAVRELARRIVPAIEPWETTGE